MIANVVNVQIKDSNFRVFSHQKKLDTSTSSTKIIYEQAKKLMGELYSNGTRVRLIGVRVDDLLDEKDKQISLFDDKKNEKQEKLDETLDKIKEKYGHNFIKRGGEI